MATAMIAYVIVAAFLFLGGGCLYVTIFCSDDKDGSFIWTGLVMGILFLAIAYSIANGVGL